MKRSSIGLLAALGGLLYLGGAGTAFCAPVACAHCHGEGVEEAHLPGPDGLGKTLAAEGNDRGAPPCSGCHGAEGGGDAAMASPRLAGLDARYLVHQLRSFRRGSRSNPTMAPVAKALSETEGEAAADYYAALRTPSEAGAGAKDGMAARGARIAAWGLWGKDVPACDRCHGEGGRGVPPHFPALAAQQATYVNKQFQAWRSGARRNDPDGLMQAVARRLSPEEVRAAAAHYASIPPSHTRGTESGATEPVLGSGPAGEGTGRGSGEDAFRPPDRADLPEGPLGVAIRRGASLFRHTREKAGEHVGNALVCANCHLDDGRRPGAAPLWAAWVAYPAPRDRQDGGVVTIEGRLRACFQYAENAPGSPAGGPPPSGAPALADLQAYMRWLATGATVGADLPGRGYPELVRPANGHDPGRGEQVFGERCALCHGPDGAGTRQAEQGYAFPPLWGSDSFNWGSAMHRVATAAAFIRANMPLGQPERLTAQEAWDVAAFLDRHERPRDPRQTGSVEATTRAFHEHDCYYGKAVDGRVLGRSPGARGVR